MHTNNSRHRHTRTEAEFMNGTISLKFLGIIWSVLRLEVSVYNVYITNQFQATFSQGGRGVKSLSRGDCDSKEEIS
jgi:hypothetical protein